MCIQFVCFITYLYMFDGRLVIYYDKEKDYVKLLCIIEEIWNKQKYLM